MFVRVRKDRRTNRKKSLRFLNKTDRRGSKFTCDFQLVFPETALNFRCNGRFPRECADSGIKSEEVRDYGQSPLPLSNRKEREHARVRACGDLFLVSHTDVAFPRDSLFFRARVL